MKSKCGFSTSAGFLILLLLQGCSQEVFKVRSLPLLELVSAPGVLTPETKPSEYSIVTSVDLGKQPIGTQASVTYYLRNSGQLPLKVKNLSISPASLAQNFKLSSTCAALGGSRAEVCPVTLTFNPQTIGTLKPVILVNYEDEKGAVQDYQVPLAAVSDNRAFLRFETESIDLGNDTVGYTVSASIKVIYNGDKYPGAAGQISPASSVAILDNSNSQFGVDPQGTTCGPTINQDCMIKVTFHASGIGNHNGKFNLSYFNGSEQRQISLNTSGSGIQATNLATLSASAHSFGNVVFNPPTIPIASIPVSFSGSVPAESVSISAPSDSSFTLNRDPAVSTCFASTSVNGNCTLSVKFSPTERKAYTGSLTLSYSSNGQARTPVTLNLAGSGVNPASVSASVSTLDFLSVPGFKPKTAFFTLTNSGEVALSSLSALQVSDGVNFSGAFETACSSLAPGASCKINVGFTPKSEGPKTCNFQFSYFDGRVTKTVPLTAIGTGTTPLVMEGGGTIDFGNVMIGISPTLIAAKTTGISYYGFVGITQASQLSATPSSLEAPFKFNGASLLFPGGGTCVAPLNPSSTTTSCNFGTALTATTGYPQDVAVERVFSLAYAGNSNQGSGTLSYKLSMTPRVPPVLAFFNPPTTFGDVAINDSASLSFTVKNASPYFATAYGSTTLTGSGLTITGNTCTGGVVSNGICVITVRFSPTAAGASSGSLSLKYNNQLQDQTISVSFSGNGSVKDRIAVNGASSLDFGSVFVGDVISPKTIALKVYGQSSWAPSLSVTAPVGELIAPYAIDSSACGSAADCSLGVTFTPTTSGTFSRTVRLTYTNPVNPAANFISFTLNGTASVRAPDLGGTIASFAKTLSGSASSEQVLTIKNNGSGTAQNVVLSVAPLATGISPFSIVSDSSLSNPCSASSTLLAGASCTAKIRFTPQSVGIHSGAISIQYQDQAGVAKNGSAALSGAGTTLIKVFAGATNTCLITELEQALCFGNNSSGQLGQNSTSVVVSKPQDMAKIPLGALAAVKKIAIGSQHICAIIDLPTRKGGLTCWGDNSGGKLGAIAPATQALVMKPILDSNSEPVFLDFGTGSDGKPLEVVDVSAGVEHSCVILKDGKVKCWGGNSSGQLGIGSTAIVGISATQMGAALGAVDLRGASAVSIAAGSGHTCAVLSDFTAKCWGDNYYGQLGQGVAVNKIGAAPTDLAALNPISLGSGFKAKSAFASRGAFTCIRGEDNSLKCFGKTVDDNQTVPFYGQLGSCWARVGYNSDAVSCVSNPSLAPSASLGYRPSDMAALPAINFGSSVLSKAAVGDHFVCGLMTDMSVRCFGSGDRGQLGNGRTVNLGAKPADMGNALAVSLGAGNGGEVIDLAAGGAHVCAVLTDNTLKCWGASDSNAPGLKGYSIVGDQLTPSAVVVYSGK